MTDTIAALGLLAESDLPERQAALQSFYQRWQADPLVVDKWFSLQAMAQRPDAVAVVTGLLDHEAFTLKNPNRRARCSAPSRSATRRASTSRTARATP